MGSVIPGKIDPNYQGDLRYATPIPGTSFRITNEKKVVPISTKAQPFQEQYYAPSWTVTATAQAAQNQYDTQRAQAVSSGKLVGDTFTIRNDQDERQYNQLVVAQERARNAESARIANEQALQSQREREAFFGIPYKVEQANERVSKYYRPYIDEPFERGSEFVHEHPYLVSPNPIAGYVQFKNDAASRRVLGLHVPDGTTALADFQIGFLRGVKDKPVTTAASLAVGGAMGAGARALPAALEVTGAAKLISSSPTATKAAMGLSKAIPYGLGLLYAGDVGYRTYQQPAGTRARYLGEVTSTEVVPLAIGGIKGYQISDKFIGASRWGDTSRIVTAKHIFDMPKEQQPAARATENIFRGIRGKESLLKNEPDLTRIRNLGAEGPGVGKTVAQETHSIFGRTTEIGQMPEPWITERGLTTDLDVFTGTPSKTAERIAGVNPKAFSVSKEKTGLVISKKTGQHAVDIHSFPENYPIGKSTGEAVDRDIVDSILQAAPRSKKDLLFGDTFTQEKLYVQARRKAASVFGESGKGYGPPEHRIKDAYDMLRYASYLGDDTMKGDFVTLKKYWSDPKVYRQYQGGEEFGKAIARMEWGKEPVVKSTPTGKTGKISGYATPSGSVGVLASLGISSMPKSTTSKPSATRIPESLIPSSSYDRRSASLTSITPDLTPTPIPSIDSPSPTPTPSIISLIPSLSITPSLTPSLSPSFSPSFSPYPSVTPTITPTPIFPVTPLFPGGGGGGRSGDRWGFVFREDVSRGEDPFKNLFAKFTGINLGLGKKRKTTKKKKTTTRRGKK